MTKVYWPMGLRGDAGEMRISLRHMHIGVGFEAIRPLARSASGLIFPFPSIFAKKGLETNRGLRDDRF